MRVFIVLFAVWQVAALAQPAVTIYNQDFAVVREVVPLELEEGINRVEFNDITFHLEPDSVFLRDPKGERNIRVVEQNYRADPISQGLLLNLYEGKTIGFADSPNSATPNIVQGTIVRSGYTPHYSAMRRYGGEYAMRQSRYAESGAVGQPIVEVDGTLRFQLPGIPLFPALTDDSILKPTLDWLLETDDKGKLDAELSYITGGMSWNADYNLISPEKGDVLDLVAWVTLDNQTGKTFPEAKIKLVAGDVSKIQQTAGFGGGMARMEFGYDSAAPAVSEKSFDEYHMYNLQRPSTLRDRETKQVEFLRASGIESNRFYVYDGAKFDPNRHYSSDSILQDKSYGTETNTKVWVMREFENSEENRLGIPLPAGRIRFYRQDEDGQLEFTGENKIEHTPKNENVQVYTGNAFDIVGERLQTQFDVDHSRRWLDESFEIRLRNHKEESVEIRAVEHLYRWTNWEIRDESEPYNKRDSRTVEFRVKLEPEQEKKISYTVHYSW